MGCLHGGRRKELGRGVMRGDRSDEGRRSEWDPQSLYGSA